MLSTAFAALSDLSLKTKQPSVVFSAMQNLLCSNIRLTKRTATFNLLKKMKTASIGTREVELFAKVVTGQNVRKYQDRKLVAQGMKAKVDDAQYDVKRMRSQFYIAKTQYHKVVKRGSAIDRQFTRIMKIEVEKEWAERKEKNKRKFEFIKRKRSIFFFNTAIR